MKYCNQLIGERENGEKVYLSERRGNNCVIGFGGMGSGKTQTMTKMFCDKDDYQGKKIAINYRRCLDRDTLMPEVREEYEKKVSVIDVKNNGLPIPLFDTLKYKDGKTETVEEVVHRITNLLKVTCNMSKTPSFVNKLKDAVAANCNGVAYKSKGGKCITDWLRKVDSNTADKTLAKIENLCKYLKDGNFLDTDAEIIELDLNGLYPDDQTEILNFLLEYVNRLAFMGHFMDQGITIYIDEAQNLNYDKGTAIREILNEGRRLGVDLMLLAQSTKYADIKGYNVVHQCATKLFFKPIEGEEKIVAKMIAERRKVDNVVVGLKDLSKGKYIAHGYFKSLHATETEKELEEKTVELKFLSYPIKVSERKELPISLVK